MKSKKIIAYILVGLSLVSISPSQEVKADSFAVVSMANDITPEQKSAMYEKFGVKPEAVKEIVITNKDERESLLGYVPEDQIGTVTISCAYIEPTAEGTGVQVSTSNLTWVTTAMLQNALITAGVKDAKIIASAPFNVSGTGALTGVLKAYETSDEVTITPEQKEAANEELVATGQIGQEIGQQEAATIVNEIKTQVIKDSPKTDIAIGKIINNVTNNYGVTLTDEDKAKLTSVMSKINDLDYDYSDMKDSLAQTKDKFMSEIDNTTLKIKESGVLEKAGESAKSFIVWIGEGLSNLGLWLKGAFSDKPLIYEKDGVKYNSNGQMIQEGNLYIEGETRTPDEIKAEEEDTALESETAK